MLFIARRGNKLLYAVCNQNKFNIRLKEPIKCMLQKNVYRLCCDYIIVLGLAV